MRCFHPLDGWQREDGGPLVFHSKSGFTVKRTVRCGQCIGCRVSRSREWAIRIMGEARMHEENSFVTLTYDDANLPHDCGLHYRDFQLFMKRLRKSRKARFFMCGEYGGQTKRPHFHACLFGVSFPDGKLLRDGEFKLYSSGVLSKLWPVGFSSFGALTLESAQYVAGYVTKKVTGDLGEYHYERVDGETGECFYVAPEFCHMSLGRRKGQGIGGAWIARYAHDVAVHNGVVRPGGVVESVPRYYRGVMAAREDYLQLGTLMASAEKVVDNDVDGSVERLAAQERVALARHNLKKRILE